MTFQISTFLLMICFHKVVDGEVVWYRTAQSTTDRLTPQAPLNFSADFEYNNEIVVNRSQTYQTIVGFGGAFTESASYIFANLTSSLQQEVIKMYFSADGHQYSMARLPIGSCDFSLQNYNYDSTKGDVNLNDFTIAHDTKMIIPFIKLAMSQRSQWTKDPLNIVASPWSPPAWMKQNQSTAYCPTGCNFCNLREEYHNSWALYFSKFLSAYAKENVQIWGVTVQNEPGYCPPDYEGMHWTPSTQRDYIKQSLGPRLSSDHPEVKILILDHNKEMTVEWAETIFSDADAAKYVWGTAVHWYTGDHFDQLNTTHYLFPEKAILATEATEVRETDPKNPVWEKGEHYAHDIIGDINNWVVGFIDWNLLLDYNGGPNHKGPDECEGADKCGSDAMILVDLANQVLYPQVFYWYVGHISKFVPPGSVRIDVKNTTSLESTAFLTPNKECILVIMNKQDGNISLKVADILPSSNKKQAFKISVLAHSIQTFTYNC